MRHSQQGGRSQGSSRTGSEGGRARSSYRDSDQDDRSYSAHDRDEDYDNYSNYDDIEDEGYERGGYGRTSGRGGEGRSYNLSEREYRDRDYVYDEDEGYREENVRGRRGFAAMDPEEQREIASMGGRASHERDEDYSSSSPSSGRSSSTGGRGRQSQTSSRNRSTSSRSGRH